MKIPTLLLICLSVFNFWSQKKLSVTEKVALNRYIENGQQVFLAGRTNEALEVLNKAEAIDAEYWMVNYLMAQCHYDLSSFYTAESYIKTALKNLPEKETVDADFFELFGKIYHRLGNMELAVDGYKKASIKLGQKLSKENGIDLYLAECEAYLVAQKSGEKLIRKPLSSEINSLEDEYAPILLNGGERLIFTARRPETTGENINPDDMRYFEDMYYAVWDPIKMDYQLNTEFFKPLNTNGFDAMSHVNATGTHAYLTINTSEAEKTTKSSDLFEITSEVPYNWEAATLIKGKKVNTDYFEGGATVSDSCPDGNFMVFISDRQATETGLDLFYFPLKDDASGIATRLPKEINTDGNETTPFLTSKGDILFFSSDALAGFGGYDIYYSKLENGVWSKPTNLGPKFNSVNDDTHFRYYPDLKIATWASMADKDGFFSYDLFQADLKSLNLEFQK